MSWQRYLSGVLCALALTACGPTGAAPAPAKPAAGAASAPATTAPSAAAPTTAPAQAASSGPLSPPVTVRYGDLPATANAAIYVAVDHGYFREEGIDVQFEIFDSTERTIPALATDQIDVGAGGINAGVFSAIARGLPLKIVAGISRNEPGFSSSALVVRKELIDSGRVRDYADLRGTRFSLLSKTSGLGAEYSRVLDLGGITEADLDLKLLSFPDATLAMANGATDAGFLTEPFVARLTGTEVGVRWKGADEIYPDHQITTLLYAPGLIRDNSGAAVRFLSAYVRGARAYRAYFREGADRTPLYKILAEYTPIKDLSIYAAMVPSGIHPDGALNRQSLEADQELWVAQGAIPQRADLSQAVDLQYLEAALRRVDGAR